MIRSKGKPDSIGIDPVKEVHNNIFQSFLNNNNIGLYSRITSFGSVFEERFNRTVINLLKRPVFEKGFANWIDVVPTIAKQNNNRVHSLTKLTPIQASLKKNEGFVYNNLLDKRKKKNPKFQINDLVRVADLRKNFSKRDTTNWVFKLITITEIIKDTIATYQIDNLPEGYSEALLKKKQSYR